jgi:hypothetical protein
MSPDISKERVMWAAAVTGSALAAATVYWLAKKALDAYVPYQVHPQPACAALHVQQARRIPHR